MQLDYVILGLLALRRFSGYDLRKLMDGPLKYIGYAVQLPQIYRRLAKLVERGWVEFDVDARQGGPDAKLYRMTDAGRDALWEWARSEYVPAPRPSDPEFTIRFIFAGQLDPALAVSILETELEYRLKHEDPMGLPEWAENQSTFDAVPQLPGLDADWARQVHWSGHELGFSGNAHYIAWLKLTLGRMRLQIARGDV